MSTQEKNTNDILNALKECIAKNDANAFHQLFYIFSKKLVHFAYAIVKIKDAVSKVVHEVFIRLWKQKENVSGIQSLRVYLNTAVKNASLNYLLQKDWEKITGSFDSIDILLSADQSP